METNTSLYFTVQMQSHSVLWIMDLHFVVLGIKMKDRSGKLLLYVAAV